MLLLTIPEAAGLLSLGVSTVKLLIRRGELPVVRCGRAVRVPREDLGEWVTRRKERQQTPWLTVFGRVA
ncbi:MAG: helix-turn-helix domain-containing protein [Candidatus Dormibacteraceae bacterium]